MKKNLLLALMFAGIAGSIQAQNTYLNIVNAPTSGGRFLIPNNTAFDLTTTNSRTYTFRMMVPTGTANNTNFSRIFTKGDNAATTGGLGLTFGTSTTIPHTDIRVLDYPSISPYPNYGNTSNAQVVFGSLNDGNWHHIAVVYNDTDIANNPTSKVKIYYDGVFLAYASNTSSVKAGPIEIINTSSISFGSSTIGGSPISAAFDDIRIWDHSLTPAEVVNDLTATINATTAPTTTGLLAAYDFQASTMGNVGGVPDITAKTSAGQAIANTSSTVFSTGASTPTLANKKFDKNSLNVYLDTKTNILNINAPEANGAISVIVYDLLGKIVATSKSNSTQTTISLSSMNSGVYLVNVTDGTASYTQKIIKN